MSKLEELATLITPKTYQITPKQALLITKTLQISDDEFLRLLAKFGLDRAYAPISGFHVGSAAVTVEGAYFIGNNMEFLGLPLSADTILLKMYTILMLLLEILLVLVLLIWLMLIHQI
eukprot:TRINITY_DN780_c0_g1_i4.p1 TRINITY_DN780_c0_g1~~TRINITY_DN780_c0_g1_i4.p1  ORF type:complete len:118 (+),score=21.60 TRINITY_DN780_c0_g1_i4:53-406(+)